MVYLSSFKYLASLLRSRSCWSHAAAWGRWALCVSGPSGCEGDQDQAIRWKRWNKRKPHKKVWWSMMRNKVLVLPLTGKKNTASLWRFFNLLLHPLLTIHLTFWIFLTDESCRGSSVQYWTSHQTGNGAGWAEGWANCYVTAGRKRFCQFWKQSAKTDHVLVTCNTFFLICSPKSWQRKSNAWLSGWLKEMIITKINLASFHTSPLSWSYWNLECWFLWRVENPERNPRRKARTNGGGRLAPSPLRHSCS